MVIFPIILLALILLVFVAIGTVAYGQVFPPPVEYKPRVNRMNNRYKPTIPGGAYLRSYKLHECSRCGNHQCLRGKGIYYCTKCGNQGNRKL